MKNSKLIELVRTLSKTEFREFTIYVKSQSQKEKKRELNLINFLKKYYPDFTSKQLTKENCFGKLFPDEQKINTRKVLDAMSSLYQMLEDFIVVQELKYQDLDRDYLLLKAYQRRKLDKHFLKKFDRIEKRLEELPVKDNQYFFNKFVVNQFAYDYSHKDHVFTKEEQEHYFNTFINSLDEFFFITKLIVQIEILNRKEITSVTYSNEFAEIIFNYIQNKESLNRPLYQILSRFISDLKASDYSNYEKNKQLFFDNINLFCDTNKKGLFNLCMNYCLRSHYAGYISVNEILEIYKKGLDLNLLEHGGYIPQAHFSNIVSTACLAKEFSWIESIIEEKTHLLNPLIRKDVVTISKATVYFHQKMYRKTLSALSEVEISDDLYKITGKSLQLRAYYELNEFIAIDSLFLSLKQIVRRNKLQSKRFKESYTNFIDFTKKLIKIKDLKFQRKDINKEIVKFKKEEEGTENLFYRLWFKVKIDEL